MPELRKNGDIEPYGESHVTLGGGGDVGKVPEGGAGWTQRSAGLLLAVGVNKEGAQNKLRVRGAKSEW